MLEFIASYSTAIYVAELVALIALFLVWESRRPFLHRSSPDSGVRHVSHCLLLTVNQAVAIAAGWLLAWSIATLVDNYPWGLLPSIGASGTSLLLSGILLLDLTQYLRHRIMHLGWFWRAHQVHHSDDDLDWSTEFRFHPIEVVVSVVLRFAAILLLGIPGEAVIIYAFASLATGILQHSNVQLAAGVERTLSRVIVTPALHRVHHADNPDCYDRNFAVIFIWWDMLLGSYRRPEGEHKFGLPGDASSETRLRDILASPFRTARTLSSEARPEQTP